MALLITIAIRLLETIFAVGLIGSVLVLVLTMIEDFQDCLVAGKVHTK
jgi:hypothetical protein